MLKEFSTYIELIKFSIKLGIKLYNTYEKYKLKKDYEKASKDPVSSFKQHFNN